MDKKRLQELAGLTEGYGYRDASEMLRGIMSDLRQVLDNIRATEEFVDVREVEDTLETILRKYESAYVDVPLRGV